MKSDEGGSKVLPFASIPNNFKIDKYAVCEKWTINDWYAAIFWRIKIQDEVESLILSNEGLWSKEEIEAAFEKISEDILSGPEFHLRKIPTNPGKDAINEFYEGYGHDFDKVTEANFEDKVGPPKKKKSAKGRYALSLDGRKLIRNHTVADLFDTYNEINKKSDLWARIYAAAQEVDLFSRYFERSSQVARLVDQTPSWKAQNDSSRLVRSVTLVADMNGTDVELKRAFSFWLKSVRKLIDVPVVKDSNLDDSLKIWVKFSVLPYMDLLLLAQIHRVRYRLNDIKLKIYKREDVRSNLDFYSNDRMRKMVLPMVLDVFSRSTLIALKKEILI